MTAINTSEFPLEASCPDVAKLNAGELVRVTLKPSDVPWEELMGFLRVDSVLFGTCTVKLPPDLL